MCQNCSKSFSKFILIIINLIFMAAGLLMLGFSIAAFVNPFKFMSFFFDVTVEDDGLNDMLKSIAVFGIIMGSIVVIVAFFGFTGAACDSICLLAMYLVLNILIVLAEIALIITAAVLSYNTITSPNTIKFRIESFYYNDIQTSSTDMIYRNNSNPWTSLQLKFKCCGLNNFSDYSSVIMKDIRYRGINYANSSVPLSCCPYIHYNETSFIAKNINDCISGQQVNQGCLEKLVAQVRSANSIILGVAAGIVGVELLLIIFAIILIHNLRKEKNGIV